MTLLTPNLLADSNTLMPYNLTNFTVAYDKLLNNPDPTVLFIFKTTENKENYSSWLNAQVRSDQRISDLIEIARKHRHFYESMDRSECTSASPYGFYSDQCQSSKPNLKRKLTSFWEGKVLETLQSSAYQTFWPLLEANILDLHGSEKLAFDLFSSLIRYPKKLGLVPD